MPQIAPPSVLLSTWSAESIGLDQKGGAGAAVPASGTWPSTRRIVYAPFWLVRTDTVRKLWCLNGGTVSGNVEIGIYRDSAGLPTSKIVSSGSSVNQAGTNVIQEFDITDTRLDAGSYWMAATMDNTTGAMFRSSPSQMGNMKASNCFNETPGVFGLPATATPVIVNSAYIPMFGLAFRTLVA